jgi:hypothetical protein
MFLRNHPLLHYRGLPSWPPYWVWTGGLGDKRPKGEVGVLRRVAEFYTQQSNRCFLFIDYQESSYGGVLTVNNHDLCTKIVRFLQAHYNRPIVEIGGLELPHTF